MENRWDRMQDFLVRLAKIAQSYPDEMFRSTNVIYGELTRIGLTNEQRNFHVGDYFQYWINEFYNKDNIDVFVSENWKYFCQFKTGELRNERTHIKMYIPFKPEFIYESANKLFSYLAENNINHLSKIGKESRVDGVVVRVSSKEDALKIAKFVETNEDIKKGLYPANPFLLNDGNIAYATDANYSFNSELASYLYEYILKCYNNGTLNNVNIRDFFFHVRESYIDVFYNKDIESINNYMSSRGIENDTRRFTNLANKSKIVELLLHSLGAEDNLNRVIEIYDKLMDQNHMLHVENEFKEKMQVKSTPTVSLADEYSNFAQNIESVICATFEKYGYAYTLGALNRLIKMKKNDSLVYVSGKSEEIEKRIDEIEGTIIFNQGTSDLNVYLERVLRTNGVNLNEQTLDSEKLKFAVNTTFELYSFNNAKQALETYVQNNDSGMFTRTNGARFVIQSMTPEKVKNIIVSECGELNYDLYLNNILNKKALEIKCNAFQEACVGTIKQHNMGQLQFAISKAINEDSFGAFSNCGELGLRKKLMETVKPEETQVLMKAILIKYGIDNENDLTQEFLNNLEVIMGMKENNPGSLGQR